MLPIRYGGTCTGSPAPTTLQHPYRPGQLPRTKNQITPTGPLTSSHAPTPSPNKLTAPDASLLAARPLLPTAGPPRGGFAPRALPQCHPAAWRAPGVPLGHAASREHHRARRASAAYYYLTASV